MGNTLDYYNQNAGSCVQGAFSVDFTDIQDKFIQALPDKCALDYGCGSGRNTNFFLEAWLCVEVGGGSIDLCKNANGFIGIQVRQMLFQELDGYGR